MPCGTKIPMKRLLGIAAVLASGVCAGIMESSSGSARVTPAPRISARREMCFLVMNISAPLLVRCALRKILRVPAHLNFLIHLERLALHHAQHQRRKPVVVLLGVVHNG